MHAAQLVRISMHARLAHDQAYILLQLLHWSFITTCGWQLQVSR